MCRSAEAGGRLGEVREVERHFGEEEVDSYLSRLHWHQSHTQPPYPRNEISNKACEQMESQFLLKKMGPKM